MAAAPDFFLEVERSITGRAWRDRLGDPRCALAIAQQHGLPEIVARVLAARRVGLDEVPAYLDPTLRRLLPDPCELRDMAAAARRVAAAITAGERVGVIGDYDVDGATACALLQRFFSACGSKLLVRVPDRLSEGYGPSPALFDELGEGGARLVLTLDCGIAAHQAIAHGRTRGLEVVVVDHHQAGETLPEALAVVDPNRHDDVSGLGNLAAVGLAFLLAVAVNRHLREQGWFGEARPAPDLLSLLDLVALGTVCDQVPLTGLNRAFVTQGLKVMAARGNRGLAALADAARLRRRPDTYAAGFMLGPRVNAAGRLGEPGLGAELLATGDAARAAAIAERLERLNRVRQEIEREVLDAALIEAERALGENGRLPAIVVCGEGWHAGVIGLVASRLAERFARPAIVIAFDGNGVGVGSCRSVPGIDLGAAVRAGHEAGHLLRGGGHAMAAGLTIERPRLGAFRAFLEERLGTAETVPGARPLELDGALSASAAGPDLVEILARAGPFGAGNPEPCFAFPAHRVSYAEPVGQDHLRCTIRAGDGSNLGAIAFRAMGTPLGRVLLDEGHTPLHLAGSLSIDDWGGGRRAQLRIVDAARPARRHS